MTPLCWMRVPEAPSVRFETVPSVPAFVTPMLERLIVAVPWNVPPEEMVRAGNVDPPPVSVPPLASVSVCPLGITYFAPLLMVMLSYVWDVVVTWVVVAKLPMFAPLLLFTIRLPFVADAALT